MIEPGQPCETISGSAFCCARADVDEVDVEAVDRGDELGERVQLRLAPAPVLVRRPVAGELLDRRELDALGLVIDRLPFGRPPRRDPAPKVDDGLVGHLHRERSDGRVVVMAQCRRP